MKEGVEEKTIQRWDKTADGDVVAYYYVNDDGMKVLKDAETGDEEIIGPDIAGVAPPPKTRKLSAGKFSKSLRGFRFSRYILKSASSRATTESAVSVSRNLAKTSIVRTPLVLDSQSSASLRRRKSSLITGIFIVRNLAAVRL